MEFQVIARCHTTRARVSRMKLPRTSPAVPHRRRSFHSDGLTMLPTFMPVATQAAIKGLTPEQVESLGVTLILNNTYHLNLRPGLDVLSAAGGAHNFQGWRHNLLTVCSLTFLPFNLPLIHLRIKDSGGFQLVSLSKFTKITEEGALFHSPFTGEPTMLTVRCQPRRSMVLTLM